MHVGAKRIQAFINLSCSLCRGGLVHFTFSLEKMGKDKHKKKDKHKDSSSSDEDDRRAKKEEKKRKKVAKAAEERELFFGFTNDSNPYVDHIVWYRFEYKAPPRKYLCSRIMCIDPI
jgi:hypothetical protein